MALEITIPKLGLTMTEGLLDEWLVEQGTFVREGDMLMRLSTDKVDVDVEAEGEGLFHPGVPAGTTLPPGAVVGWLLAEGEEPPPLPAPVAVGEAEAEPAAVAAPAAAEAAAVTSEPVVATSAGRAFVTPNARRVAAHLGVDIASVRGTGPAGRVLSEDVEDSAAAASAAVAVPAAGQPVAPARVGPVSPLVRLMAKQQGVDLSAVAPSRPDGLVRRDDVARHAQAASVPSAPLHQPGDVIPLTGIRGAIARNMVASLQSMAQLTLGREADVTSLVATRAQLKKEYASLGLRTPTVTDFVVRAVALALRRHPLLNASVVENEIRLAREVNVGIAVAVDGGLVVPVLRDADTRSMTDLAAEAGELAATARAGRLGLPQLEGGTFSVTSLGTSGIDFFTPVISPGNVAILGVGRIKDGIRWEGSTPVRTDVITLSLTFDHRAVDGAPAAEFLETVSTLLGKPVALLAG